MADLLSIHQLKKNYGTIQALKGIDFTVPQGCVFGILGPNGSGKTTLLGILLDVLKASEGTYQWHGFVDANTARKKIGTLLETPNFFHYLTAYENLEIVCKIKELDNRTISDVLKKVNLWERRDTAFATFSLGMKQRLAIASALLGDPEVLVLDEPTNGLDPVGIAEIRQLIGTLHQQGKTIIMASHMLDEVEKVCTDVAILRKGELLLTGNVAQVLSNEDWLEIACDDNKKLEAVLQKNEHIKAIRVENKVIQISLADRYSVADVNLFCMQHQIALTHIYMRKRSLESKFMELTNYESN
jgi:ABC-type multidrug transport system ATPase subunit